MATKRWVPFLLLTAMILSLVACGGSTANVQNPPPPPQSNVSIAFQPQPAGSIAVGFTENLTAVVTNDSSNDGVDWTLTCQNPPNCGTLSTPHTASGAPVTFTAPTTLSANSMVVEIVALATAAPTQNVVAPITISTFNNKLQAGNYVLQVQGVQNSTPSQFAGVITLDGQGNVTGGEQTVNANDVSVTDSILPLGSSYFLGSDGRGAITLNDPSAGTETFAFVFLNNSQNPQALISELDNSSAVGTMDLQQTSFTAPSGSYAFAMNGTDVVNFLPLAFGGVFDIAAGQTAITGVTDEIIASHLKLSDGAFLPGSQVTSGPDPLGQVTLTLSGYLDGVHPKPLSAILTGYIVDSAHIALIETDTSGIGTEAPFGTTGGLAIAQAAANSGNFNNASLSGAYVFEVTGVDLSPNDSGYVPATLTSAAMFVADGQSDGAVTGGYTDSFFQLNCVQSTCKTGGIQGAQISAAFTGTYSVDSSSSNACGATSGTVIAGTGRACLIPDTFTPAPTPSYRPEFFLYLTGGTGTEPAALVLGMGDIGSSPTLHYPSIGTGVAYSQSLASPAFTGAYGFSFTQQNGSENDGTAQLTANPNANPQLSGFADTTNELPSDTLPLDHSFTGSFSTPASNGIFPGALGTNNNDSETSSNVFNPQIGVNYYSIDPTHGFFVETDLVNATLPEQPGQISIGYYTVRSPLCSTCP